MKNMNIAIALLVLASLSGCSKQAPTDTQPQAAEVEVTETTTAAQNVLPFPEPQSASVVGKTLKDSKHQWRQAEKHLPEDAPNIVIFMTDDAGFANSSTFGGPVSTPTLERLANSGISYNRFHTTAQCSASYLYKHTRARRRY